MAVELHDACEARGMSYVELAEMIGTDKHYVRRVFRGDITASTAQLERMAHALGLEWCVHLRKRVWHRKREPEQ